MLAIDKNKLQAGRTAGQKLAGLCRGPPEPQLRFMVGKQQQQNNKTTWSNISKYCMHACRSNAL